MNQGDEKAKGLSRIAGHEEKAREGSSTPLPETSTVRPPWRHKTEEKEGGGEGTKAAIDKGAERSIQEVAESKGVRAEKSEHNITKDVRGQVDERMYLGMKQQHRRLQRELKRRAPTQMSGKQRTFSKGYAERSGIRNVRCGYVRAERRARG